MAESGQCVGQVVWFDDARGYGFIRVEGVGDVFVHYSAIVQSPTKGRFRRSLLAEQRVALEIGEGPRGRHAVRVKVIT